MNLPVKYILNGVLAIFFIPMLWSQEVTFQHFSTEDGMPSDRVYRIMEDSKGYLWLSTDAGVSRYNGIRFENFTTEDGLADNDILSTVEDQWGRIWFLSYNGRLSYYRNGMFYSAQNDTMLAGVENSSPLLQSYVDSHGNLWIRPAKNGVIQIFENEVKQYYHLKDTLPKVITGFMERPAGHLQLFSIGTEKETEFFTNTLLSPVTNVNICNIYNNSVPSEPRKYYYLISCGSEIESWYDNRGGITFQFPNDVTINRIDWENDTLYWVHTNGNGSYLLSFHPEENESKIISQILPNASTSTYLKDSEGNKWFATLDNGLFKEGRLKIIAAKNLFSPQERIKLYQTNENETRGYSDINLYEIETRELESNKIGTFANSVIGKVFGENDAFFSRRHLHLFIDQNQIINTEIPFDKRTATKTIVKIDSNDYIIGAADFVYLFSDGQLQPLESLPGVINKNRILEIAQTNEGERIFGTNGGLFIENKTETKEVVFENPSPQITAIQKFTPDLYLIGTFGDGLFLMDKSGKVDDLSSRFKFPDKFIVEVKTYSDGRVLVITKSGGSILNKLLTKDATIFSFSTKNETEHNTLYDAELIGDTLLTSGDGGLISYLLPSEIRESEIPGIDFYELRINNEKWEYKSDLILEPWENNLSIYFQAISVGFGKNLKAYYKLEGMEDSDWQESKTGNLSLISVAPGHYSVSVKSQSLKSGNSSQVKTLHFRVLPRWYQTLVFKFSLGIILLLAGVITTTQILRSRARRESLNRRITQSRLTALRTQMNPHFIFNSLNSIQIFVSQNEKNEAFLFLSRFGKLMRRVLDNSEEEFIPIQEEIETLKLYLQLEQLRGNNKFDFEFIIDDELEPDYHRIPPTLLQPMIENAIWHGVMNRESGGKISISFSIEGDIILCKVTDNGIGRERAGELSDLNPKEHKSKGLKITRERLELLNEGQKKKMSLSVADLKDAQGNAIGTEVTLRVPFN